MDIEQLDFQSYITLKPIGELDAHSSIVLDERIKSLIDENKVNIHIDARGVHYMSSAGLGVFVSYLDEIQTKGGKLVLSHLTDSVNDVFELLGLNQLVTIVSDGSEIEKIFDNERQP